MTSKLEVSLVAGGVTICAFGFLYRKYQQWNEEEDTDFIPKVSFDTFVKKPPVN